MNEAFTLRPTPDGGVMLYLNLARTSFAVQISPEEMRNIRDRVSKWHSDVHNKDTRITGDPEPYVRHEVMGTLMKKMAEVTPPGLMGAAAKHALHKRAARAQHAKHVAHHAARRPIRMPTGPVIPIGARPIKPNSAKLRAVTKAISIVAERRAKLLASSAKPPRKHLTRLDLRQARDFANKFFSDSGVPITNAAHVFWAFPVKTIADRAAAVVNDATKKGAPALGITPVITPPKIDRVRYGIVQRAYNLVFNRRKAMLVYEMSKIPKGAQTLVRIQPPDVTARLWTQQLFTKAGIPTGLQPDAFWKLPILTVKAKAAAIIKLAEKQGAPTGPPSPFRLERAKLRLVQRGLKTIALRRAKFLAWQRKPGTRVNPMDVKVGQQFARDFALKNGIPSTDAPHQFWTQTLPLISTKVSAIVRLAEAQGAPSRPAGPVRPIVTQVTPQKVDIIKTGLAQLSGRRARYLAHKRRARRTSAMDIAAGKMFARNHFIKHGIPVTLPTKGSAPIPMGPGMTIHAQDTGPRYSQLPMPSGGPGIPSGFVVSNFPYGKAPWPQGTMNVVAPDPRYGGHMAQSWQGKLWIEDRANKRWLVSVSGIVMGWATASPLARNSSSMGASGLLTRVNSLSPSITDAEAARSAIALARNKIAEAQKLVKDKYGGLFSRMISDEYKTWLQFLENNAAYANRIEPLVPPKGPITDPKLQHKVALLVVQAADNLEAIDKEEGTSLWKAFKDGLSWLYKGVITPIVDAVSAFWSQPPDQIKARVDDALKKAEAEAPTSLPVIPMEPGPVIMPPAPGDRPAPGPGGGGGGGGGGGAPGTDYVPSVVDDTPEPEIPGETPPDEIPGEMKMDEPEIPGDYPPADDGQIPGEMPSGDEIPGEIPQPEEPTPDVPGDLPDNTVPGQDEIPSTDMPGEMPADETPGQISDPVTDPGSAYEMDQPGEIPGVGPEVDPPSASDLPPLDLHLDPDTGEVVSDRDVQPPADVQYPEPVSEEAPTEEPAPEMEVQPGDESPGETPPAEASGEEYMNGAYELGAASPRKISKQKYELMVRKAAAKLAGKLAHRFRGQGRIDHNTGRKPAQEAVWARAKHGVDSHLKRTRVMILGSQVGVSDIMGASYILGCAKRGSGSAMGWINNVVKMAGKGSPTAQMHLNALRIAKRMRARKRLNQARLHFGVRRRLTGRDRF